MEEQQLIQRVTEALLRRRGITWTPDSGFYEQLRQAAEAALALLRSHAGNREFSFADADDFDLAVVCAWYLAETKRAEFLSEYKQELIWLRMREALKNGTDENPDVS